MAILIEAWCPDMGGESRIAGRTVKRVDEIPALVEQYKGLKGCVRVSKRRSDRRSDLIHYLWVKPGYRSADLD